MMTSHTESHTVLEMCASVKRLGYATSCQVRLYGEDFDVLSDPFPEEDGIAVRAKAKKDSRICVLRLPAPVLQTVGRSRKAA